MFIRSIRTVIFLPFLFVTGMVVLLGGIESLWTHRTLGETNAQLRTTILKSRFFVDLEAKRAAVVRGAMDAFYSTDHLADAIAKMQSSETPNFYNVQFKRTAEDYLSYLDSMAPWVAQQDAVMQASVERIRLSARDALQLADAMVTVTPDDDRQRLLSIWSASEAQTDALLLDISASTESELGSQQTRLDQLGSGIQIAMLSLLSLIFISFAIKYALIERYVMKPLGSFDRKVQNNLRTGSFDAIGLADRTEIGRLGRAFDQLMARIQDNEQTLHTEIAHRHAAEDAATHALQDLRLTKDSLVRSEKLAAIGTMVGGVAHEINNPLMGLTAYLERGRQLSKDPDLLSLIDKAERQVGRIERIVRSMLVFARTSGKGVTGAGRADLAACVTSAQDLLEPLRRSTSAELETALPPDLPMLRISQDHLQQILINLIKNALEALQTAQPPVAQPAVWISARGDGPGRVQISVADNGPGVPENTRTRLFEPFFTTKEPGKGTGLGLAVSLQLAEVADGKLEYRDRQGGGAEFLLTLPEAHNEQEAHPGR